MIIRQSLPSFKSGFARSAGESANPSLWKGLVGAWVPALGVTGVTTLRDVSGNGNHGTMNGSMTIDDWVAGERGYALDFDGSSDYVDIANPDKFAPHDDNWTFVSRFKTSVAANGRIVSAINTAGGEWLQLVVVTTTGVLQFSADDGSDPNTIMSSSFAVNDGKWHQSVVQRNSFTDTWRLWIDGAIADAVTNSGETSIDSIDELLIGAVWGSGGANVTPKRLFFAGQISEVRIYNRKLQDSEIAYDYANFLAPFQLKPLTISLPAAAPPAGGGNAGRLTLLGVG